MNAPARPWSRWRAVVTVGVTVTLLAVLMRDFGGGGVVVALKQARAGWVAAAFAISCVCVLLGAFRWDLVLAGMGFRLGFRRTVQVVLATWPPAVVTPSRANELLRALAVRDCVPLPVGTASVLAEKIIDLFVLLVLAAVGAALQALWLWCGAIAGLVALEGAAVVVLVRRGDWLARLPVLRKPAIVQAVRGAADSLGKARGKLLSACAVSLAIRLLTVGVIHTLLVAVGIEVRLFDTLTLWPAATLVGVAPVTLGGMGTRDAAFIYLLEVRGVHAHASALLAATMGYSAVAIWSFALIGLPFMVHEAAADRSPARTRA